jgi:hypothetical protein
MLAVAAILLPKAREALRSSRSVLDQGSPDFASIIYLAGYAWSECQTLSVTPETRIALTLRPTGMSSPASKEPVEFLIYDDAEEVGRI